MTNGKLTRLCAMALPLMAAAWGSSDVLGATLYQQLPNFAGTAYSSQNDPTIMATVWDDFTLATAGSVTGVAWDGEYFNGAVAPISGFTIKIWSDSSNAPGAVLATTSIVGNANETPAGISGNQQFSYSASLASAFAAGAGTKYWLSIVPDIAYPPQWAWQTSFPADGLLYQDFLGSGPQRKPDDAAFTLTGDVGGGTTTPGVPLPAAVYGALPGLAAIGLRRRSRR